MLTLCREVSADFLGPKGVLRSLNLPDTSGSSPPSAGFLPNSCCPCGFKCFGDGC